MSKKVVLVDSYLHSARLKNHFNMLNMYGIDVESILVYHDYDSVLFDYTALSNEQIDKLTLLMRSKILKRDFLYEKEFYEKNKGKIKLIDLFDCYEEFEEKYKNPNNIFLMGAQITNISDAFGSNPTVNWALSKLQENGFSKEELQRYFLYCNTTDMEALNYLEQYFKNHYFSNLSGRFSASDYDIIKRSPEFCESVGVKAQGPCRMPKKFDSF